MVNAPPVVLQDLSLANAIFSVIGFLIVCGAVFANRSATAIDRGAFRRRLWQILSAVLLVSLVNSFVNPYPSLLGAIFIFAPLVGFGVAAYFAVGRLAQLGLSRKWALLLGIPMVSLLCLGYLFFKSDPTNLAATST
ncbi:MAG: hypothetical protein H7Z12_18670 [Rhodospirillaceae bacterium]|nr:hypothetical protein [Rhodospirillales bacterium]